MKYKITPVISVLILILVITLVFQVKIPLCYNTFEEKPSIEPFILYDVEIVTQVKEQIEESPFHYIKINGHSMKPAIKHNDICVPKANYEKGDIISFYTPVNDKVELISHRISHEENNNFLTKGDNNLNRDNFWLTEEQVFCYIPEKNLFDKLKFAVVESEGRFSIFSIFG